MIQKFPITIEGTEYWIVKKDDFQDLVIRLAGMENNEELKNEIKDIFN